MRTLLLLVLIYTLPSHALDIGGSPAQLRFFVGTQKVSPGEVNDVLKADGVDSYSSISTYGIEGTYQIVPRLNVGVRGEGKWQKVKETASPPANTQNPYYSSLQQSAALLVARVDLVTGAVFRMDAFGAAGTAATSMDIRGPAGDSKYSHAMSSIVYEAGASIGVGWGNMYFSVEAGNEWNKINGLTKTGASSSALTAIDLSGGFLTIGVLFNGLPSWIHRK